MHRYVEKTLGIVFDFASSVASTEVSRTCKVRIDVQHAAVYHSCAFWGSLFHAVKGTKFLINKMKSVMTPLVSNFKLKQCSSKL